MPESKKKEKKTCQYELKIIGFAYRCNKPLYDNDHCIFHSEDKEGKKNTFMKAFWKEYETQEKKGTLIFIGFVFPPDADLKRANLQGADLKKADLQYANLQEANLQGADLVAAKLNGAKFHEVDLKGANLSGADLRGAKFRGGYLQRAKLSWADLQEAILFGTNLQEAILFGTNLQGAKLQRANLREANLESADLRGADLSDSSFEKAKVNGVKYDRSTKFKGIDVTQALGSPAFVRFAKDQEFLEEMQSTTWGKVKYHVWNIVADCGRSMGRWLLWCLFIALFFGAVFADYSVPNIKPQFLQDFLISINPEFHIEPTSRIPTFFTPYYFSIVTFTTLGFGDVTPLNLAGEIWLALEVFLGYIMLGGLISIFANKLGRRS